MPPKKLEDKVSQLFISRNPTKMKEIEKFINEGIGGLVVADELNMNAVRKFYGGLCPERAALDAVMANDIILVSHPEMFIPMRNTILEAAEENREIEEKVNDSYGRIIEHKNKIGIL